MECAWDSALLARGSELPPELLYVIENKGDNQQYLEAIIRAALDARYTPLVFSKCRDIFAHVCASLRTYGSLPDTIATLGRVVPFAPFLAPYATQLLSKERYSFEIPRVLNEDLLYLLGLLRLLRHDHRTFKQYVELAEIQSLLQSHSRPVIYLGIRVLQICLDGADDWFEKMVQTYLGEDSPESNIDGPWDDRVVDYRFLTLWEEERHAKMLKMISDATPRRSQQAPDPRTILEHCFHPATALISGHLLPVTTNALHPMPESENSLVVTPTITSNLEHIMKALESQSPLILAGLAGSGKTALLRHVAQRLGKLDKLVTLHLNEQSDAKMLIGIYATGDNPGSFVWKPGVLTTAVQEGRWVLIEDLDRAPNEILGTLLPLIERQELLIANRKQTVHAAEGFRVIATVRSTLNHRGEETRPSAHMLGARHWQNVGIDMPGVSEQAEIARQLYPSLSQLVPQLMAVFERLQSLRTYAVFVGQSKTGVMRAVSPRDLLKWCKRITNLLQQKPSFTSQDMDDIFMEAVDCFVGALPDGQARNDMAAAVAEELRIDPQRRDYLLGERDVRYEADKSKIAIGRYVLPRLHPSAKAGASSTFSTNHHTSRMLERVAAAVINREPLLLVGETGVGKTTAVQHLATHLGKRLEPFNLSQQSEAGDLLGGFKPVTARSLMVPMKDKFDELFHASFSVSKNQQFLDLLGKQMAKCNWKAVCKLWQQALKMVDGQRPAPALRQGQAPSKKRRVESQKNTDFTRWDAFAAQVTDIERRLSAGTEGFAFSFVEGNIVKAVRNGDWVLLDEINLASPDTLESIADLLDPTSPSLLLTEAGNIQRIEAHPDFRVFGAMNPATDVGKKDLPPGIRSRFTELYVESPDKDIRSLQSIVRSYLRADAATDQAIALDVSTLYQKIISLAEQNKLVDGAGQKPHFSLRTLTRTLTFGKCIAPQCNLRRAIYEGFQMSFLTFLDAESARLVQPLLDEQLFGKRSNIRAELQRALRTPNDGHQYVQGYPDSKHWVRRGEAPQEEQPHYILTPFIKSNLENLVRATSTRQFPVLIQGPTSSGKTSMIEYLAKRTGHEFVRINNHEHTDLQEYLGTYVSGGDGRLQFQEGVLVRALREGHWIVLDELNLAPTDVLEALNRLLDDNRELLVPETQETIRPHENFMLFATQNPAGLYGGRKTLSRAFRNRFLELHFDDIPVEELQEILHRRTQLPESRCKRIVSVYRELSVLRQESRLFEQRSFATLRDLFRWALRQNDTIEQLAANGFMLLGERVRKEEERRALKEIIEKEMSTKGPRVTISEESLYAESSPEIQAFQRHPHTQGVVWTKAMRRLYALVSRAVQNNEPVLLVGETGCGKTTVCQMLAEALQKELHVVNAHQNTETGDLIGSQRPVRNRSALEARLRTKILSSDLLEDLDTGAALPTDALLDSYDKALSSLSTAQRREYLQTALHVDLQMDRTRFKALFEWVDGSLVQAMKDGSFFLLDEISLADDSVLERLNSVLEPQRSILLAEKGSMDVSVTAAADFQFFATMNPGGDYGKRELSPALRNRFTEIWVPALSDKDDVVQIMHEKLNARAKTYASAMVSFAHWFRERYNTSASSSVSIRDALAWVQFVNTFEAIDTPGALVHGAAMVYIDTLGANPAGLMTLTGRDLEAERSLCLVELGRLVNADAVALYSAPTEVALSKQEFKIGPFCMQRETEVISPSSFTFEAPTTRVNAMRVVRAMQLSKPVMLEGSPGVGKTALVTAIANAVGVPLTRINLSEQTDLLDLFGSDAPVEGAATGTFAWRDAPFLRAMKKGEWVLLDEMNLASQSVLEGLNACLDHRGEVYVPELGQTFTRHPEFRLFAAQNPHHQGGGRKGLPASFVNRFTVVYADTFQSEDLSLICRRSFPDVSSGAIEKAVKFVSNLNVEVVQRQRFGTNGGPWEFNLRDISRWLALAQADKGLVRAGTARDFIYLLFSKRFRSVSDRACADDLISSVFKDTPYASDLFCSISAKTLQLGLAQLPRNALFAQLSFTGSPRSRSGGDLQTLQYLMLCIQQTWPVILTGPTGSGKTSLISELAALVGAAVETIPLNAETDAMDLIGGYEQADPTRQVIALLSQLREIVTSTAKSGLVQRSDDRALRVLANVGRWLETPLPDISQLATLMDDLQAHVPQQAHDLLQRLQHTPAAVDKARFEWIDGILVEALQQGKWLVLDNANLCSSSVLDRLNSLLEPNGTLIINERTEDDGGPRVLRPHPDFRIFLTVDPRYGELSRAMRNRAVELYVANENRTPILADPLSTETATMRFKHTKMVDCTMDDAKLAEQLRWTLYEHMGLRDRALFPAFERQLQAGLYDRVKDGLFKDRFAAPADIQHALEEFYRTASSQADTSADFACVQTIHPLNNQTLVQQDQQIFSQATTFALMHDVLVKLATLQSEMNSIKSNAVLMQQLKRADRSARSGLSLQRPRPGILETFEIVLQATSQWARQIRASALDELSMIRATLDRLCALCWCMLNIIRSSASDPTLLGVWMSTASDITKFMSTQTDVPLGALTSHVQQALVPFENKSLGLNGRGCTPLWQALRPATPASLEQLDSSLHFEGVVARFDHTCELFTVPLQDLAELRASFARALRVRDTDPAELRRLSDYVESLIPQKEGSPIDDPIYRGPHFKEVFERLSRRSALFNTTGPDDMHAEGSVVELLAGRPTLDTVAACVLPEPGCARAMYLLSATLPRVMAGHDSAQLRQWPNTFLDRLRSVDRVPLGQLGLLETECQVLSKLFANNAHNLCLDELGQLDTCLHLLCKGVLQALTCTDDPQLLELAAPLLEVMDGGDKGIAQSVSEKGFPVSSIAQQLQLVVDYLADITTSTSARLGRAAEAWTAFALACLTLYVGDYPLDPAMRPQLEQAVYDRSREELLLAQRAMRELRTAVYGAPDSLRLRLLQEDLDSMGPEPALADVCRPPVPEIVDIHAELTNLTRAVQPLQQGSPTSHNPAQLELLNTNLDRIRARLKGDHRAYADLTSPVVGFIDCLRVGSLLAVQANSPTPESSTSVSLASITPLMGASLGTWGSDEMFADILSVVRTPQEVLYCMNVLAVRCSVRPYSHVATRLHDAIERQFSHFYEQWSAKLSQDQKRTAAKSSLYRYQGDHDLQDEPSEEDLDELFPTGEREVAHSNTDSAPASQTPVLVDSIACVHRDLFAAETNNTSDAIASVLRQYAQLSSSQTEQVDTQLLLPTIFLGLGELTQALTRSGSDKKAYNIYTDSNVPETRRLSQTLRKVRARFAIIHEAWPEHATPVDVVRLCDQTFTAGHSSPLARLLPGLEKLHAAVSEWQHVASREYSVQDMLEELTGLIIGWRQLELSSWTGLLNRESAKCERDARSWWFVAYENIIAVPAGLQSSPKELQQHAEGLLSTLEGFLANSGLGEFKSRLDILRVFVAHLSVSERVRSTRGTIVRALRSFVQYYQRFEPVIAEQLAKGRIDLETQIRNLIQVASWKDRNIEILKQSAKSSHKRLLRLVHKYRNLLAQSVAPIVSGNVPDRERLSTGSTTAPLDVVEPSALVHVFPQPIMRQLPAWDKRPERFRNVSTTVRLIHNMATHALQDIDAPVRISSFVSELVSTIIDLRKATPATLTEENKSAVQHLKSRKRRLLAEVLKEVRSMGFHISLSDDVLSRQNALHLVLAKSHALAQPLDDHDFGEAEFHFHRLLSIMPAVRDGVRKHSDGITQAEASRCVGLIESVLYTVVSQRASIHKHLESTVNLRDLTKQLTAFATSVNPVVDGDQILGNAKEAMSAKCLRLLAPECLNVVRAQLNISTAPSQLIDVRLTEIMDGLSKLENDIAAKPKLPDGVSHHQEVNIRSQYHRLIARMRLSIKTACDQDPKLEPVLSQLHRWTYLPHESSASEQTNGYTWVELNTWVADLLSALNDLLVAMQGVGKVGPAPVDARAWLLYQQGAVENKMNHLQLTRTTQTLAKLLLQLGNCGNSSSSDNALSPLADVVRAIQPINAAYTAAAESLLSTLTTLHLETTKMASQLAATFVELAQQGFCTPPEKGSTDERSHGDVESGTGLGEGEGAEDISKDMSDDEDLSELAQQTNPDVQQDTVEDAKDAVDMADEEMQGALDQQDQAADDDDDGSDRSAQDEDADAEKEAGEVDDLGPSAVDEKMWDGGDTSEKADKEADDAVGSKSERDLAAAENETDGRDKEEGHDDAEAAADEEEGVDQGTEKMDPTTKEEENLQLPDDITMDDANRAVEDMSDLDDLSENAPEDEQLADAEGVHSDEDDTGEHPDRQQEQDEADDATELEQDQDADEERAEAEDDNRSDVLMEDNHDEADNNPDETVFGESGTGADENKAQSPTADHLGVASPQPEGTESESQQDQPDARASGAHGGQQSQKAAAGAEDSPTRDTPLPFKQIGDALDKWYQQHREIEAAKEPPEAGDSREGDIDMADAHFEHIPNSEAAADTQALGAASAEQSTALDEEKGLSVNEEDDHPAASISEQPDDGPLNADEPQRDDPTQADTNESVTRDGSKAFVGEPRTTELDHPMETASPVEHDHLDDMDQQLVNTHISPEELPVGMSGEEARSLWSQHEASTRNLALVLTEHLRLILQPTQATKMRGDFRTGKRLNIKRIIPYIASSYKRDKIWMRRSIPSKRAYQIMVAIDDSKSMAESQSRDLAFETLALVAKSMSMLEVGQLSAVGFGENVKVAHEFSTPFTSEAGADVFKHFTFAQSKTNVRRLLVESMKIFQSARLKGAGAASELWQLQLIISDGVCEDHPSIRQLVRQAHEERIMIVFIIVDAAAQATEATGGPGQSILNLQTAEFAKDGAGEMQLKMVKYLDTFPFGHYLIVRDVQELPAVLAGALRQWFAEVVETGS